MKPLAILSARSPRLVLGIAILSWTFLWASNVAAAPTPKIGQKIEVKTSPFEEKWEVAIVTEELAPGKVWRVRLSDGSTDMVWLKDMRPLPKKASMKEKGELRTWTDSTGKFKIKARMLQIEDGKVVLENTDGSETRVPLDKLSEADRKFAEENKPAINPFEKGKAPAGMGGGFGGGGANPQQPPDLGLWSAPDLILRSPARPTYQPDPSPVAATPSRDTAVRLPPMADFFEKVTGLAADPAGTIAIESRGATFGDKEGTGSIQVIDLQTEKLLASIPTTKPLAVADILSGDKPKVLTHDFSGLGGAEGPQVLQISEWANNKLVPIASWAPGSGKKRSHRNGIEYAKFIDENHVLTLDKEEVLALWDTNGPKPMWRTELRMRSIPLLSPGKKYIVLKKHKAWYVVDVMQGKVAVALEDVPFISGGAGFSPDGSRMAISTSSGLGIWDLATGKKVKEYPISSRKDEVEWITNDQILLGNRDLYDLPRRILLWRYELDHDAELERLGGDRFMYTTSTGGRKDGRILFTTSIPHEAALQTAAGLTLENLLVLRPGDKVSLDLKGNFGPGGEAIARKALQDKMAKNEVQVVDSANLVFKATAKKGKSKEVAYQKRDSFGRPPSSRFGRRGGNQPKAQKRTVTPMYYKLALFDNGKQVWSKSGAGSADHTIFLKENESLDQAIHRLTNPSPAFFKGVDIPKLLTRHPEGGSEAFGETDLSYDGS